MCRAHDMLSSAQTCADESMSPEHFFVRALRTRKPFVIVRLPEKLVNKNKDLGLPRKRWGRKIGVDGVG